MEKLYGTISSNAFTGIGGYTDRPIFSAAH
jgi:hypothetical protein